MYAVTSGCVATGMIIGHKLFISCMYMLNYLLTSCIFGVYDQEPVKTAARGTSLHSCAYDFTVTFVV